MHYCGINFADILMAMGMYQEKPPLPAVFGQISRHHFHLTINNHKLNHCLNALFHSSQKPTRKLAARTFIQPQYLKALAACLRVGFCDEWKRGDATDFNLLKNISRAGTPRKLNVVQLPSVSARTKADRKRSD